VGNPRKLLKITITNPLLFPAAMIFVVMAAFKPTVVTEASAQIKLRVETSNRVSESMSSPLLFREASCQLNQKHGNIRCSWTVGLRAQKQITGVGFKIQLKRDGRVEETSYSLSEYKTSLGDTISHVDELINNLPTPELPNPDRTTIRITIVFIRFADESSIGLSAQTMRHFETERVGVTNYMHWLCSEFYASNRRLASIISLINKQEPPREFFESDDQRKAAEDHRKRLQAFIKMYGEAPLAQYFNRFLYND
jgi:hypothetical protein